MPKLLSIVPAQHGAAITQTPRTPRGAGGGEVGEALPPLQPDLKLNDTVPFRLSRNHFMIEKRDGSYYVRDLRSTLGTIVNGEPIGDHFRGDDAPLRAGENEVIAGGVDSPVVFSEFIAWAAGC